MICFKVLSYQSTVQNHGKSHSSNWHISHNSKQLPVSTSQIYFCLSDNIKMFLCMRLKLTS
jgi:hypothetical protein